MLKNVGMRSIFVSKARQAIEHELYNPGVHLTSVSSLNPFIG
jgi:hypothetical protein